MTRPVVCRAFAVKSKVDGTEFFNHVEPSKWANSLYPKGDDGFVYEVELSPHPDQVRRKGDCQQQQYWGWLKTGGDRYEMVYPSYAQFSMCFAYGFEAEEARGRGKAFRLLVVEVSREVDERKS